MNADGIINVSAEYVGETSRQVGERVDQIADRLLDIFKRARQEHMPPGMMADYLAQQTIARVKTREPA